MKTSRNLCILLATAFLSIAPMIRGEILLGWHTPTNDSGSGEDSTPDIAFLGISGLADGITRQLDEGVGNGSTDNSFGSTNIPSESLPTAVASWALETSNTLRSQLTLTITNNTGEIVELEGLHFDYDRENDAANPPTDIAVSYLSGNLQIANDTPLLTLAGIASIVGAGQGDYLDREIVLTGLADNDLANGESASFQIVVSGGGGGARDSLFIDNIAVTGTATVPPPPPPPSYPAPAIAWHSGSATSDSDLSGVNASLSGSVVLNSTNGSNDGSYGALSTSGQAPATAGAFELANDESIDLTITNNAGRRVYLSSIFLDFNPRTSDAPTGISVSYLSGDLDDATTVLGSLSGQVPLASNFSDYHDLDIRLSDNLDDTHIDDGESATFRITAFGASGSGLAYLDNIGFAAYRAPNLLVLLSDDQGYADVGFNTGNNDIPTPNIDRIADMGVNCTNAYVSYSVCGPSRAGMLTGRYQQRFGFERNPQYGDPQGGIPHSEMMISEALEQVGYTSGAIGKWHVGTTELGHPLNRGFDEFYGFLGGSHKYLLTSPGNGNPQYTISDSYKAKDEDQSYQTWILKNHDPVDPSTYVGPNGEEWYLTDEFSAQAVDFIERHQASPWFLYMAYNAPHSPMEAPQRYLDRFPGLKDYAKGEAGNPHPSDKWPRKTYAAMVSAMDDGIGLILDKLDELNLADDTIVFFLSDNGGKIGTGAENAPLRGDKGDAYEGGMRVPFAVRWPGAIPSGVIYENPVISLDIYGTIADLAGAPTIPERPLDGVNIVPFLAGLDNQFPHDEIYLRKEKQQRYAVVAASDKKKFLRQGDNDELYDLSSDVGEGSNIAGSEPARLAELVALRDTWVTGLIDPIFIGITDPANEYFDNIPSGAITEALLNSTMLSTLTPNDDGSVTGLGNWVSPTLGTWTLNPSGSYNDPNDRGDHALEITLPASSSDELLIALTLDTAVTLDATTQMQVYTQFLNINEAANNGIRIEFQDSSGAIAASVVWGGINIGTLLNAVPFESSVPFTPRDNSDGFTGWDQYDANVRPLKVRLMRELVSVDFDGFTALGSIQNEVNEIKKIAIYSIAGGSTATAIYFDEIAVNLYEVGALAPFTTAWHSGSVDADTAFTGITTQLATSGASSNAHGSVDGSYGSYNVVAPTSPGSFELSNGQYIDISVKNDTTGSLMLENIWLDFNRDQISSPTSVSVIYLSGDLEDVASAQLGFLSNQPVVAADLTDFNDLDCLLSSTLIDRVLGVGESAVFRISVSGASGAGKAYIDNIGLGTLMLGIVKAFNSEGNDLVLRFFAEANRTYGLQYSPNLSPDSWQSLPDAWVGSGTELELVLDPPVSPENALFYRLIIAP